MAQERTDGGQSSRTLFFLPETASVDEAGRPCENKQHRPTRVACAGLEHLLPVLSQDSGNSENERTGPENGQGTGDQNAEAIGVAAHSLAPKASTRSALNVSGRS